MHKFNNVEHNDSGRLKFKQKTNQINHMTATITERAAKISQDIKATNSP